MMSIEVVVAWAEGAVRVAIDVPPGTTLAQAVALAAGQSEHLADTLSRLAQRPDGTLELGIFGQLADPASLVAAGDRVEIYRPLQRDPREARRALASQGLNVTHAEKA